MEEKSDFKKSLELFWVYFTSMLFAFTGGNMTWPIIEKSLTEKYKLIDEDKILEYFALGQSLPGTLSLNTAILIGLDVAGSMGAFAAAAGSVLPAFFGMLLIVALYSVISGVTFITSAINGIRAASIGIIFVNAIKMLERRQKNNDLLIAVFALVTTLFLKWNVVVVMLLCGVFGIIYKFVQTRKDGNDLEKED